MVKNDEQDSILQVFLRDRLFSSEAEFKSVMSLIKDLNPQQMTAVFNRKNHLEMAWYM
jgi:hypothetical protein